MKIIYRNIFNPRFFNYDEVFILGRDHEGNRSRYFIWSYRSPNQGRKAVLPFSCCIKSKGTDLIFNSEGLSRFRLKCLYYQNKNAMTNFNNAILEN